MDYVPISSITVGDRTRKDLGDIDSLARSMAERGLIHPLAVDHSRKLIAGYRRLKAAQKLGWAKVPIVYLDKLKDAADYLKAERDENTCRKAFSKTEMVEMGRRLEALLVPAAAERKKGAGKTAGRGRLKKKPENKDGIACGNLPQAIPDPKTRDQVADAVGVSGRTYEKAKQVVEAAESDPSRNGDLPAKMDSEGVSAAHKELKQRQFDPLDSVGLPLAGVPLEAFRSVSERIDTALTLFRKLRGLVHDIAAAEGGVWYRRELSRKGQSDDKVRYVCESLRTAQKKLESNRPFIGLCPYCEHDHPGRVDPGCKACLGMGWGPERLWKQSVPEDYRAEIMARIPGKEGAA